MFPLITWKEQAICLQKLQAVVITFSLLNFLEEYLIVKRTLTTLMIINFLALYWKCAQVGPIFFKMHSQNVFIEGSSWIYKVWSSTVDTKTTYLCTVICLKKLTLAHNVFEATELCCTRADILKLTLDRTLVASQITKI